MKMVYICKPMAHALWTSL
jgi:hypothetical protein